MSSNLPNNAVRCARVQTSNQTITVPTHLDDRLIQIWISTSVHISRVFESLEIRSVNDHMFKYGHGLMHTNSVLCALIFISLPIRFSRLEIYKERAQERGDSTSEWVCVPRVCEAISP